VIIITCALAMLSKAGIVVFLSVCLSVRVSLCLCVCLSVYLSVRVSVSVSGQKKQKNYFTHQKLMQFGKCCVMLLSKSNYISVIIDFDLDLES